MALCFCCLRPSLGNAAATGACARREKLSLIHIFDILINAERIADQCSNLGVYTISQFDPSVMNSHHEYIHRLHQGNDPVFNREYQEKHEKYFGMLSAIND